MLQDLAASKFGFWIVAWTMVLADSAFLLEPGKFVFTVSRAKKPELRVSSVPFTMLNKEVVFAIYSFPFRLFFVSSTSAPPQSEQEFFRRLSNMKRWEHRTKPLLVLSSAAMAILLMGPILAAVRGIQFALVVFLPALYALAVAASLVVWSNRRRFGLANGTALRICAEVTLCPVFLVNIAKRLSFSSQRFEMNAFVVASFCSSPKETESAIHDNLLFHHGE
jgi:hypothetical protein